MGGAKIAGLISKADLKDPYDRLDFLGIDEIVRLEQLYGGRQIKFRQACHDAGQEYPELVAALGHDKARMVVKTLRGLWVYFPALRRNCTEKIKSLIKSEFNGYNYAGLAARYGYTERHIRNIVDKSGRKPTHDENQMTIFDCL